MHIRPDIDNYFDKIRSAVSERATCSRGRAAAVIVKNNHVISTGYVGAAAGLPSCDDVGHLLKQELLADGSVAEHCVRSVHAEVNAILTAARYGIAIEGSTMYCTMTPCMNCAMCIINSGITEVIISKHYRYREQEDDSLTALKRCGVKYKFLSKETQKYESK